MKNKTFLILLLGETASGIGSSLGIFLCSYFLYEETKSVEAISSFWLIYFLPSLSLQLFIGPFLDRWNRKKVIIFSQCARALAFLLPMGVSFWGTSSPVVLYAIALVMGLIQPLYQPSSLAIVPSLFSKEQTLKVNAYLDGTARLLSIAGPPVGGLLIPFIALPFLLVVVGMLYLIIIALFSFYERMGCRVLTALFIFRIHIYQTCIGIFLCRITIHKLYYFGRISECESRIICRNPHFIC